MKTKKWTSVVAVTLFGALAMPVLTAAQDNVSQDNHHRHHQYRLIDMGTFGGPNSAFVGVGAHSLNHRGIATGGADTPIPDPNYPNCFGDCFVQHTFLWQNGVRTDLGALPGVNSSGPNDINASGVVAGISQNGAIDPVTGQSEYDAVVWQNGQIINLGTFGGNWSYANALNDRGQVAGFALNTTPDSFNLGDVCMNGPFPTQMHAFISQGGALQDLGTLGGPDSCALYINESGQATGHSFTNSVVNPLTGFPTLHPFLWDEGTMLDLGTLGGTFAIVNSLNSRGQVIGQSSVAGDLMFHPFLWSRDVLTDLGTFGGNNGTATSINDDGDVVGEADLPGSQVHDAFLWKHGVLTDLGNLGLTSFAFAINSQDQVVGHSKINDGTFRAFLWENRGPMIDLNTLIPPGSAVTLNEAPYINDRGEIASQGTLPNGDTHAFLLIPCDDKHPGECQDYSMINAPVPQVSAPTKELPATMQRGNDAPTSPVNQLRNRLMQRYHVPGQPAAPRD